MTTILLVRHAKAGDRSMWEGDDRLRPLTRAGRRQSEGLVELLRSHDVTRLLSSPYVRCVETLEPAAGALGLAVEPEDTLAEGSPLGHVHALLQDMSQYPVVALCSHGDVIADLIACLAETGTPGVDELRWKKGSTWVLTMTDGIVTRAEYLPPPA